MTKIDLGLKLTYGKTDKQIT